MYYVYAVQLYCEYGLHGPYVNLLRLQRQALYIWSTYALYTSIK